MQQERSGKLVRDGIPALIAAHGGSPEVLALSEADYLTALHEKLLEEAEELRAAPAGHQLEELADLHEVLLALAAHLGYSLEQVSEAARAKRADRGGFAQRLWLRLDQQRIDRRQR